MPMATAAAAPDFEPMSSGYSAGGLRVALRIAIAQRRDIFAGIGPWLDDWGPWVAALLALLLFTCVAWPVR